MTTETRTEQLLESFERALETSKKDYEARVAVLHEHAATIEALPEDCDINVWAFGVYVTYIGAQDPEWLRGEVQRVLNVPAQRTTDSNTGETSYIFHRHHVNVTITGGKLAHGCQLVPYEEKITRFKVVCYEEE